MKTYEEVERRLLKLRKRYRLRYIQERVGRHYLNCVHNYKHTEAPLPYSPPDFGDRPDRAPAPARKSLKVLQEKESSIHICMYGSAHRPMSVDGVSLPIRGTDWNGEVCDELDRRAPNCPWFKPARSEEEVGLEFDEAMSDAEFVFEHYKDMAALQWVLDIRDSSDLPDDPPPPEPRLTLWERIVRWWRGPRFAPQLPAPSEAEPEEPVTEPNPEVPKDLWDAASEDSSS